MNLFQFSTKGLHTLRAEYLRDIDEAAQGTERIAGARGLASVGDQRTKYRAGH